MSIYYQNGMGVNGERDCDERWNVISKELPEEGVVFDIGSAESFFGKKIADNTDLLSVSIEGDGARVEFAEQWMSNGNYHGKTVLCNKKFNGEIAKKIADTCEWIDVSMLLSVLHWMPDHREVLSNMAKCSAKVIVELPDYDPNNPVSKDIGPDLKKYLEETTGREVRHLAKVKTHTGSVGQSSTREVWVVEGDIERRPSLPYIGCGDRGEDAGFIQTYKDGHLNFNKKGENQPWVPGINCMTLASLNTVFPSSSWWSDMALNDPDIEGREDNLDTCIWNLLGIRGGTRWIDIEGNLPSEDRSFIKKRFENPTINR